MKTISFILFSVIVKFISGQTDSLKTYNNQIKISPVRLITDIRGLQISYERQYLNKYSTQLTSAYIFDPFAKSELATWSKMSGYSIGIEQKYFIDKDAHSKSYISADFTFLTSNFENINMFQIKSPKDSIEIAHEHFDTIMVDRKTYTLAFRYGIQLYIKHFVVDFNIGFGLRYRDVTHLNKLHENDVMTQPRHLVITHEITVDGKYFTPNIPIGLKIGYRF